ncbi:hypothetical protein HS041_12250 [Planomonospora sp. ID67723]|uniref:hypothetical protein n=1 Tax=Planomonospora sp. ID67723 TaxID=2738134 RepID=UPI0018C441C5|nr:hypothetical protein [Planomonospora sp. ID67723]MBG0828540.1 hypothetical protein [Planomonospora sp. ID67723]
MADGVFNVALGKIAYYGGLPATNDALIAVLIKTSGLQADATLRDHDTLSALLAASNDEADATNYVRKTLSGVTVTVDDTNERVDIDCDDLTYTSLGGASNNTLSKIVICYDPDTTGGTDADLIPLTHHDITLTTDGTTVTVTIPSGGFARAA